MLCFLFYCPALECISPINRHEMKTPPNPHVKHIIASEGWPSEERRKRTRRIRSFRESSWADTNSNHLWIALLSIHPSPVFCHWIASGDNKINPSTQDMGHRTDISLGVCILWNVAGWLARIFSTSDMNFPPNSQCGHCGWRSQRQAFRGKARNSYLILLFAGWLGKSLPPPVLRDYTQIILSCCGCRCGACHELCLCCCAPANKLHSISVYVFSRFSSQSYSI